MQKESYFERTKAVTVQFVLLMILVTGYSYIIIDSDIFFFDFYVKDDIARCHPNNVSQECEDLRVRHGCERTDQLCLGNKYWSQVNKQAFSLAGILFLARLVPSIVNHVLHRKNFTLIALWESIWWALTALVLFMSGVIDWGYYTTRGMDVPETLDWLNNVGFFVETKTLTGLPDVVEKWDLYLTFFAGLFVVGLLYGITTYIYSRTGWKTLA